MGDLVDFYEGVNDEALMAQLGEHEAALARLAGLIRETSDIEGKQEIVPQLEWHAAAAGIALEELTRRRRFRRAASPP